MPSFAAPTESQGVKSPDPEAVFEVTRIFLRMIKV